MYIYINDLFHWLIDMLCMLFQQLHDFFVFIPISSDAIEIWLFHEGEVLEKKKQRMEYLKRKAIVDR